MVKFISVDLFSWHAKDWIDQPLHFFAGAGLVLFICLFIPAPFWALAVATSISIGCAREYQQHPPIFIDMDSFVWSMGSLTAIAARVAML